MFKTILAALALFLLSARADAACITGKLQYVASWTTTGLKARLSGGNGTTRPLRGLEVNWTRVAGGSAVSTTVFTNATGDYSACSLAAGTWQMTLRWQDGPSAPNRFRLNASSGALTKVTVAPTANVVLAAANVTKNLTINSATSGHVEANIYDVSYEWFDTIQNKYGQSTETLWNTMNVVQMTHAASGAVGGNFQVLAPHAAPVPVRTYLHELGHVLQDAYQVQRNGCTGTNCRWTKGGSFSPACVSADGSTPHVGASTALIEGFADFIADVVSANGNPPQDVGPGTCSTCEVSPLTGNPSAPTCGAGSIFRSRQRVAAALGDLVDSQSSGATCQTENVQISVDDVLVIMTEFASGFGEGSVGESAPGAGATPAVGTSTLKPDALGLMDFLLYAEDFFGVKTRPIWANSCWQPGDAADFLTQ